MKIILSILLLFVSISLNAHSDPNGEIFPNAHEIGEEFHILFTDLTGIDREVSKESAFFKNTYNGQGQSLVTKERIDRKTFSSYWEEPDPKNFDTHNFIYRKYKECFYLIPECFSSVQDEQHHYFILDNNHKQRKTLDIDQQINIVTDILITDESIFLLASLHKESTESSDGMIYLLQVGELTFFEFSRATGKILYSKFIGEPTSVWSFPHISNFSKEGENLYFVWNQKGKNHNDSKLNLVKYNITEKQYSNKTLPYRSNNNISISIATNHEFLCLAYHGNNEKIAVEFIPLLTEQDGAADPKIHGKL